MATPVPVVSRMYFFAALAPDTFTAVSPACSATSRKSTVIRGRSVLILELGGGTRVAVAIPCQAWAGLNTTKASTVVAMLANMTQVRGRRRPKPSFYQNRNRSDQQAIRKP